MKIVFIAGPTATGKSRLALDLSLKCEGKIINADSVQFFKSVNIGSSKPSKKDLKAVPHFLFDIVDEGQEFTAFNYKKMCLEILSKLKSGYVFIVGGSGFYINALISEMYDIPEISKEIKTKLTSDLEEKGILYIYEEVKKKDPDYAKCINPNDKYRILRAASIMRNQPKTITQIKSACNNGKFPYPYTLLRINLNRDEIKKNIIKRTQHMIENGLIDEVQALLNRGLKNWSPMKSVGYKQAVEYIDGKFDKNELQNKIVNSTMKLVKKQNTWFNRYDFLNVNPNEDATYVLQKLDMYFGGKSA